MAKEKVKKNIIKIQFVAVIVAILGSKIFGLIADFFWRGQIHCFGLGDVGGCDSNNIALYILGFYYGLLLCTSFAQFGLIKKKLKHYFFVSAFLITPSLIGGWLFTSAVITLGIGVVIGILFSSIDNFLKKPRQADKT